MPSYTTYAVSWLFELKDLPVYWFTSIGRLLGLITSDNDNDNNSNTNNSIIRTNNNNRSSENNNDDNYRIG